jgi:protein-disulfide isomerase
MKRLLLALLSAMPACAPRAVAPAAAADPVVATIGGKPITLAELDRSAGRDLYDLRERTLEEMVIERVVEPAAKAAGKSAEDFLNDLAAQRVPEVSEAEAAEFFEQNHDRLPDRLKEAKFADVKQVIVKGLTNEKRKAAMATIVDELKEKAGVHILLEPPKVQVDATGPSRGPDGAPITIVEFSDFQCPYCARGRKVIDDVVAAYGNRVRVVYRDFPLSFHENAQRAAEAGQCAHEQGKFWAMHDWMFDNQSTLAADDLAAAARKLGLDGAKFDQCVSSGRPAEAVAKSMKAGTAIGIHGTPAFVLNGVVITGAQPFETFKAAIDKQLAAAKPARP